MSDDPTRDRIEAGNAASWLLENAAFKTAMANLDAEYHVAWREAETVDARENCHRYVKLIEKLVADITSIATTGQLTRKRLEELAGKERTSWLKNLAA